MQKVRAGGATWDSVWLCAWLWLCVVVAVAVAVAVWLRLLWLTCVVGLCLWQCKGITAPGCG